jgi:hypothetical protein
MQAEKKTFTKAEVEVIRFEKQDIITTSTTTIIVGGQDAQGFQPGPDIPMP